MRQKILRVIVILAFNCACVTAQWNPSRYPYVHQTIFLQDERSLIRHSQGLAGPQAVPVSAGTFNPLGFQRQVSSLIGRMVELLVVAAGINRILGRNNPEVLTQPATFLTTTTTTSGITTRDIITSSITTSEITTTTEPATTTTEPASTTNVCSFSANFTNCGKSGRTGPNLQECRNAYNSILSNNEEIFNVVDGIQTLNISQTGLYRFEAYGAKGGTGDVSKFAGGKGAKMIGEFVLTAGTTLNIVIGQEGSDGRNSEPAGGGGGTFVYVGAIGGSGLLMAAAGGGGGGEENTRTGFDGQSGELGLSGLGLDGNPGFGGYEGSETSAGAGWKSDGSSSAGSSPGTRWNGGHINTNVGDGGFGGGASGVNTNGGGGGGGYTGGNGVSTSTRNLWGGSGGGSFNGGSNQVNQTGINNGHGRFEISCIATV